MIHSKALTSTIRILFSLCLLSFFGLILYHIQFNHPQTDDYVVLLEVKQYGPDYGKFIYGKWSGRLFPTYIFQTLATDNFFFRHYWIHTVAALTLNLLSALAIFWAVNKYLVAFTRNSLTLLSCAAVYLAVQVSLLPEVASAYFWFSGTVVYQSAIIFLQCQLAFFIVWYNTNHRWARLLTTCGICVQIVLINFTNEPAVIINGIFLCMVCVIIFKRRRLPVITLFILLYLISAYIMISAPGNTNRANEMPSANLLSAVAIAGGRTAIVFWHILKNPAFWAAFAGAFCAGILYKHQFLSPALKMFLRKYHLAFWPISAAAIFVILLPVMYVSNGSFPERATNLLVQVLFILLMTAAYFTGSLQEWHIAKASFRTAVAGALIISIWCNDFFGSLVKSAISAPVYDMVIVQRQEKMREAVRSHARIAYLHGYETACDSIINLKFAKERQVLKNIRKEKPAALYLFNDLENDFSRTVLAHFFGLEELKVVD